MKLIEIVDYSNKVYLLPMGDLHLGAEVDIEKFQGYIDWAQKNNAYIFLMGDLFDTATLNSPTEVWGQKMTLNNAMKLLKDLLLPIRSHIVGAIIGNHEERLIRYANFDPMENFCEMLGIEYAGYSAVLRFRIGTHHVKGKIHPAVEYVFYAHHTTGGGNTPGGKLNRIAKLREVFEGADCYVGGHNHSKALGEQEVATISKNGRGEATLKYKRIMFVDSGSFLTYDNSYAEEKMLPPSNTGAPRIRMDGSRKDLHISY